MSDYHRVFYQLGPIKWALHQIDERNRFIEIDIRPQPLENKVVIKALFLSGKLPDGVKITSTIRVDDERYRFDYRKIGWSGMMSRMKPPFSDYFRLIGFNSGGSQDKYIKGWRQRFAQQMREDAIRKAIHLKWLNTPHSRLGGLTPNQIVERGYGPLEIPNIGFVWVGMDYSGTRGYLQIQTRPYSNSENFNNCLRWFMQRGTSLNQAIRLNSQHMGVLNRQALIGSIQVLLGAIKAVPGKSIPLTIIDKTFKTAGSVNDTLGAVDKVLKGSKVGEEIMTSRIPIESKVQLLNKVNPIAIPTL